jgi:hypothetical protein
VAYILYAVLSRRVIGWAISKFRTEIKNLDHLNVDSKTCLSQHTTNLLKSLFPHNFMRCYTNEHPSQIKFIVTIQEELLATREDLHHTQDTPINIFERGFLEAFIRSARLMEVFIKLTGELPMDTNRLEKCGRSLLLLNRNLTSKGLHEISSLFVLFAAFDIPLGTCIAVTKDGERINKNGLEAVQQQLATHKFNYDPSDGSNLRKLYYLRDMGEYWEICITSEGWALHRSLYETLANSKGVDKPPISCPNLISDQISRTIFELASQLYLPPA